jgi:ABC-type phosphate transport system auxiliary subunit
MVGMKNYSPWDASQEMYELEEVLFKKANKLAEKGDSYELARMLVVINKETYRLEEEARKLRLTGELDLEVYRELVEDYANMRRRILEVITKKNLNNEVARLYKVMRFSSEVAGLYLTEYLQEIG